MEEGARKRPLFVVPSLAEAKKRVLEASAAEPSAFELHQRQQQKQQREQKQHQGQDQQQQGHPQSTAQASQPPRGTPQPPFQLASRPSSQQPSNSTINAHRPVPPQLASSRTTNAAHPSSSVTPAYPRSQATAVNQGSASTWAVPQKAWAGRGSSSSSSTSSGGTPKVLVNRARQARNPIVGLIRACPVELVEEQVADFQLGVGCGCLFVQVKYHLLHPEYLTRRLRELNGFGGPRLKLVRC